MPGLLGLRGVWAEVRRFAPGLLGLRGVWAEVRRFAPGLFGLARGVPTPGTGGNGSGKRDPGAGFGGNGRGKRDPGAGQRRDRRPVVVRTGRMVYNKKCCLKE